MQVMGPSKSRLSGLRRVKSILPLLVAATTVALFVLHVQRGTPFAIQDVPEKQRTPLEYVIFAGLDGIKSSGYSIPWDKRVEEPDVPESERFP